MNNIKKKYQEVLTSFYFMPFSINFSIHIFIEGEFNHLAYSLKGLNARLFAIIILVISLYFVYNVLYRIPKIEMGISYIKIIWKRLLLSPFLYFFIFTTIVYQFIKYFLKGVHVIIILAMLFIICFLLQKQFIDEIF